MGKFDNWVDTQRQITDIVRLYAEFNGTLTPATDAEGARRANGRVRRAANATPVVFARSATAGTTGSGDHSG